MTVALANQAASSLREALLDNGVRRVSLELQPGVAGSGWHVNTFRRGLGHHIASRPSQGLTPGLALVKRGRTDLAGPLCNGYGGYDLTARIITMGWANHPGLGGPWSVPGWGTVPLNNGRPYIFGWEFEGGYEPYTDEMHDFMARCGAGTLDWLGNAPLECWGEHKTWAPGRKVDRIGYTTESGRSRIAAVRGTREEIPMALADDILRHLHGYGRRIEIVQDIVLPRIEALVRGYGVRTENTEARVQVLTQQVVELSQKSGGGLSKEEIEALVQKVLQENTVKVDVRVAGQDVS